MMKWMLSILAIFCLQVLASAQIQHVEPLNWWVGMKDPALQVMINGDDVGSTSPVINYPGVQLVKVNRADSKNYLFLDLQVSKSAKPGWFNIDLRKDGKTIHTVKYELKKREPGSAMRKGFDGSDVIYLVTPDRFVNGDTTNDIIPGMAENKVDRKGPGARHGGDIRGMINSLDYIRDMGFTAIWPQPMVENNEPAYSYHGYAITNHYRVDPRYGTLEEYKELSAKASARGIKLIYDAVLNHSGTGYWWMNDLPYKDWLNFTDTKTRTNHKRTVNQDPYASRYDKDIWVKGWFDGHMADMNGANPFMANYLIQNTIWWIETLNLGGVRQDTYGYSDKEFLKKWSCRIMSEYPSFNMVGEEWSLNPLTAGYWQKGKVNRDGYVSCLPSIMDFPLQHMLIVALTEEDDKWGNKGLVKLYEALSNDYYYADPKNILVFADNHDMDRIYTQLNKDLGLTKMAMTYLLTTRGIPQVYYGTEVLMDNSEAKGNDGVRRSDFPGGWSTDEKDAITGKGLNADQQEMKAYLKKLLNWRKQNPVIWMGQLKHFVPFDGLYVYFRYDERDTVMVVMNKNARDMDLDISRFGEVLKGRTLATEVYSGKPSSIGQLKVPARSTVIYSLK